MSLEKEKISRALQHNKLPSADPSNIGKCRRNVEILDQQQDNENTLTLDRYEKYHFKKELNEGKIAFTQCDSDISQTQGSQIDPKVYKDILLNNTMQEFALVQSKLKYLDHNECLSKEDIYQVLQDRKKARKLKIFDNVVKNIEAAPSCRYYHIEHESLNEDKGDAKHLIEKSSQNARPLIDEVMEECKERITSNMIKFASVELNRVLPKVFTRDDKYSNCITAALKHLLHKNDRTRLLECANITIPSKLLGASKGRKSQYEVYRVFNNDETDSPTKSIIESFFKSIFKNFDEHIEWMMKTKDMKILLIVNREIFLTDGILSNKSIVGGVIFATHNTTATTINAIGIHASYRYNSFGPFLIHLSQIFGAYDIDVKSNGVATRNFHTYLACRMYLTEFYMSIGFKEVQSFDDFKENSRLESIGKHLELPMWIDYTGDDRQIIMEITTLCYKMRNYISPTNFLVENCLYNSDLFAPKQARFFAPESWKNCVLKTIQEFKKNIEKNSPKVLAKDLDGEMQFMPSSIYMKHIDILTLPFIGQLFSRCTDLFEQKSKKNRYQIIKQAIPSLLHLKLYIYKANAEYNNKDDVWCCLTCTNCEDFCHVKNTAMDPIVTFLMKCIFSIWYQHVFALQPKDSNSWNKVYPDWHMCPKRYGNDLERLKFGVYTDSDRYNKKQDLKPFYIFYKYLEAFLEIYVKSLKDIQHSAAVYLCRAWCHSIVSKKNQLETEKQTTTEEESDESDNESSLKEQSKQTAKKRKRNEHSVEEEVKKDYSKDEEMKNLHQGEWTDTDSDISSDISLNNFRIDGDIQNLFSKKHLKKIKNEQMKIKVNQYLRIKSELEEESEQNNSGRKSHKLRTKRMKFMFKKLHKEILSYMQATQWYRQAKKDIKIQSKFHSIEYIKVSSKKELPPASKKYLSALKKMTDEEKIEMMEKVETKKKESLENHFVMYYGDNDKCTVVHPNWFTVQIEDATVERVSEKTVKTCKKKPNVIQKLRKSELNVIKKSMELDVDYHAIDRIERIKSTGQDTLVAYMDGSKEESIIKYIGYDRKSRSQYLTDAWLELNFKHLTEFWKQIKNLNVGESIKVPIGSSNNQNKWDDIQTIEKGPKITFVQKNNQECLYYSLASVFHFMGYQGLAKLVLSVYELKNINNSETNIKNLVHVLGNQKNQKFSLDKVNFMIRRIKRPDSTKILQETDDSIVFHCILENNHSVALLGNWIFDPIFPNAMKKTEQNLRFCAESIEIESTNKALHIVYTYDFKSRIKSSSK